MDQNDDLSDLPDLEDFTNEVNKIKGKKTQESEADIGDYTKPKIEPTNKPIEPIQEKQYPGFKKGFFNQSAPKPKTQQIQEIKPDPQAKSSKNQ